MLDQMIFYPLIFTYLWNSVTWLAVQPTEIKVPFPQCEVTSRVEVFPFVHSNSCLFTSSGRMKVSLQPGNACSPGSGCASFPMLITNVHKCSPGRIMFSYTKLQILPFLELFLRPPTSQSPMLLLWSENCSDLSVLMGWDHKTFSFQSPVTILVSAVWTGIQLAVWNWKSFVLFISPLTHSASNKRLSSYVFLLKDWYNISFYISKLVSLVLSSLELFLICFC